ncbi:DUF6507 family protein [Streptomyces lonarensis]|uniref:Uncharacterized protein n=1 Tax=Streptomyces lonarensis TaxID=700599 RepID=A0A7X6CXM3_9ACTN|nr:DUF6507 family protein [Streptomyces lonarensis]NJQ04428.1 hypothetical protein [Streptomyces lonarensis]
MTYWDIDIEGAAGALSRFASRASGVKDHQESYPETAREAAQAVGGFTGIRVSEVRTAVEHYAARSERQIEEIGRCADRSEDGAVLAVDAHCEGDLTMEDSARDRGDADFTLTPGDRYRSTDGRPAF